MPIVKLNQGRKQIEIKGFELSNEVVFNYFDKLPEKDRDEFLFRAIYIGVLALMEDRLSAFLAKTSNELGTELESLKMIFDMKKELFFKSAVKGLAAEDDVARFLNDYFTRKNMKDEAVLTGNVAGELPNNKTGDIVCELDGGSRIAIECKFDKSIKLGDIESRDVFSKKMDTAWSQLIESQANRGAKISIMVFDKSLVDNSILKFCENVAFLNGIGFVTIVDSQGGDYSNLVIAYMLAKDIVLNAREVDLDSDFLSVMLKRIIKDINEVLTIRSLVENNISNNKSILKQLEKSMMLMEFNREYLGKFLRDGTLSKKDMLDFYSGDDVKDKFKPVEKEIEKI